MFLDCRKYPADYTFAQQASAGLGLYVRVAAFTVYKDRKVFRMIVDPEIDRAQLGELITSTVRDETKLYSFAYLETINGPIVDSVPHMKTDATYIRLTFL